MNTNVINREASNKTKGFRLQKLRAANLALDEIEKGTSSYFYIAIELGEDVAKITSDNNKTEEYYEEDKDYPSSKFTLNSQAVKNTLVSFYDLYITRWEQSDNICFGFYTTAEIGKEQETATTKECGITFSDKKILEMLMNRTVDDEALSIIKKILIIEYKKQYKNKDSNGNLKILEDCKADAFKEFINSIHWYFGQDDNQALKESATKKVVNSKFYNFRLEGKESYILSELLETIEERQHNDNYSDRFIDQFQIELIFNKAESIEPEQKKDLAWKSWDYNDVPDDTRTLQEKIYAVCESFNNKEVGRLTRRACAAKLEEKNSNKDYLSLKYRVLEACEEIIFQQIGKDKELTSDNITEIIENLKIQATTSITELKKDYHYPIQNSHSIKAIVLDLFDSCYLAFDES